MDSITNFFKCESAATLILLFATVLTLIIANSPLTSGLLGYYFLSRCPDYDTETQQSIDVDEVTAAESA